MNCLKKSILFQPAFESAQKCWLILCDDTSCIEIRFLLTGVGGIVRLSHSGSCYEAARVAEKGTQRFLQPREKVRRWGHRAN